MATTTLTLSKQQRDNLRSYISTAAKSTAVSAFPKWEPVPEDREMVLESVRHAQAWLALLDRVGWEFEADANVSVVHLDDAQVELIRSLEDEIRGTFEYDHRDDDRAVLKAVQSLRMAVA